MSAKQKNLGINAVLNVIRQCLSVIFPLITYPYALRVLGPTAIGRVNYASSIISYFSLIAMMGVSNYAVREGAKRRQNKQEFQEFFSQIFSINLIFTFFSYIILGICLIFISKFQEYRLLLVVQSITILLTTLGVDWVNTVYEDYFLVTIRSIGTHIITMVLLFLIVKTPDDYYKYAFLTVVTTGVICITNLIHCRKYLKIRITKHVCISQHLKPLLILFSNSLAISIYVNLDITMIGWLKGDYGVGIYSAAVRIYNIAKSIMAAIYVVAIPRLSQYAGQQEFEKYRKVCSDIWSSLTVFLLPAGVGLVCISPEIMWILSGNGYPGSEIVLRILGISLVFAIYGGLVTSGMNISLGKERITLQATIISALINFGLNLLVIPKYSYLGAAVTTLISEAFVFVFCFAKIPNKKLYIESDTVLKNLLHSAIGSIGIILFSLLIKHMFISNIIRTITILVGSVLIYLIIMLLLKDSVFLSYFRIIGRKMKKS